MDPHITPDPEIAALLRSAPRANDIIDGILEGFTAELAETILASPERSAQFRRLVRHIAPSEGWAEACLRADSAGDLNLQLFEMAVAERSASSPGTRLVLETRDDETIIAPGWAIAFDKEDLAAAQLAEGGRVYWHPGDIGLAPLLVAPVTRAPRLASIFYTARAWDELQGSGSATLHPLDVEPHTLSRVALGEWLQRSHPGTGSVTSPFETDLVRLETGIAALAEMPLLGRARVEAILDGAAGAVATAHWLSKEWSEQDSGKAAEVALAGARALLQTHPEQLPDALKALAEGTGRLDDDAIVALALRPPLQEDLALAAAGEGQEPGQVPVLVQDVLLARRRLARALAAEGLETGDLPDRPFLAELAAWELLPPLPDD
ncbi:hypothetical protein FOJ82_13470 [Tessaracoccus rhinocerotis]|uniref:Uncharacterized protein n=1 Tax=Tessaracoccus rhinocerotis TaxID=1689449 RepID=A0A553JWM2_9ACTN|nr:hypothetical protein [Tessaracoccus rhinocerotis]TRY16877.1 hypothetical protein FOJ82_13470 [Tessaracoccus rhinocerotis]